MLYIYVCLCVCIYSVVQLLVMYPGCNFIRMTSSCLLALVSCVRFVTIPSVIGYLDSNIIIDNS